MKWGRIINSVFWSLWWTVLALFFVASSMAEAGTMGNPVLQEATYSSEILLEEGFMIYLMNLKGEVFAYAPSGRVSEVISFDVAEYPSGAYCFVISNDEGVAEAAVFTKL